MKIGKKKSSNKQDYFLFSNNKTCPLQKLKYNDSSWLNISDFYRFMNSIKVSFFFSEKIFIQNFKLYKLPIFYTVTLLF